MRFVADALLQSPFRTNSTPACAKSFPGDGVKLVPKDPHGYPMKDYDLNVTCMAWPDKYADFLHPPLPPLPGEEWKKYSFCATTRFWHYGRPLPYKGAPDCREYQDCTIADARSHDFSNTTTNGLSWGGSESSGTSHTTEHGEDRGHTKGFSMGANLGAGKDGAANGGINIGFENSHSHTIHEGSSDTTTRSLERNWQVSVQQSTGNSWTVGTTYSASRPKNTSKSQPPFSKPEFYAPTTISAGLGPGVYE
ncbi:hypothetical protein PG991_001773 [Apiospora marii]|uniref:Uncharacterized protein n=1 Tax=Apiospora marii TaxID=335849 RepID=A0ABR1SN22_9PEZI